MSTINSVIPPVVAAILTSTVYSAVATGLLADRTERRKQLRDQQITLAADFASAAMIALAALRDYKPTTGSNHRNSALHSDTDLRVDRGAAAQDAINALRPLRGRIWLLFPGRTKVPPHQRGHSGWAQTTTDWAEYSVILLRRVLEVCDEFWSTADEQHKRLESKRSYTDRAALEKEFNSEYDKWKNGSWDAVSAFTQCASARIEGQTWYRRFVRK